MASNFYFNNFTNSMEQDLIESLIVESIGIYGHSVYYVPRTIVNKDDIYGEDTLSHYNAAYDIDVYVRSYDSYEGDGTFLSKFNLEIRDQIKFSIARRTFRNEIGTKEEFDRPREGDLIYSQMMKRLFVIKYVNNTPTFYQMGALQIWDITCEVFEYSNERLDTGIWDIDQIEREYSFSMDDACIETSDNSSLTDNSGFAIVLGQFNYEEELGDTYADNEEFSTEGAGIVDWAESDPFSESL